MEKNPFEKTVLPAESSEESRKEKARSILENLENVDPSSKQGRIDIAFMCSWQNMPIFRPRHKFIAYSLDESIKTSVFEPHNSDYSDIPTISQDILFHDFRRITNFYGHFLVKRGQRFNDFILGLTDRDLKTPEKILEKADEDINAFMFARIFMESQILTSEALNYCEAFRFLRELHERIESRDITEEEAKKHPNYPLALEFVLKADKQQNTGSDIVFKIASSYIHGRDFSVPKLPVEKEKLKEILKKTKELVKIYCKRPMQINQDFTHDDIVECVNTFLFSPQLETEFKAWIEYIDYFQELLDEYNSMMSYQGTEEKRM